MSKRKKHSKTDLARKLEQTDVHERRRAMRALLMNPLLVAGGRNAEAYGMVRRHHQWLSDWLSRHAGWRLQLDAEVARLRKTPADPTDHTRQLSDRHGQPFSRRRYVLLCLTLASLERSDRQTTLHSLAEQIGALYHEDPELAEAGFTFDLSRREQRRDLVEVLRLFMDYGAIDRIQGDEDQYVRKDESDVLYNVNRPILSAMLNVSRGPSTIDTSDFEERLRLMTAEPLPETDEGRNRQFRLKLTRILLDDPVLYYVDLNQEELAYWKHQRPFILQAMETATGLIPEVRREGTALVDDRGDLTDMGLPEEGTDGHILLLLAEFLARQIRTRSQTGRETVVSRAAVEEHLASLIKQYGSRWRKDVRTPGAEVELVERMTVHLQALRLVRVTGEGIIPLPAIARFALQEIIE